MEFKGTPAPWVAVVNTDLDLPSGLIKSSDKSIAHTLQKATGSEQARANANLIAAAPELLESLRELVSAMERYEIDVGESAPVKHKEMMNKANSAIAKALGQQ
ncbi:Uncharacterised protein [Klebsiella pneumoniae]|nr:Uncharacterised protein [Klebsiella pneumoniae]